MPIELRRMNVHVRDNNGYYYVMHNDWTMINDNKILFLPKHLHPLPPEKEIVVAG